jgi:exopolysaccharide production protein ExoZ
VKAATASYAPAKSSDRIAGFDLLRGICAVAVAVYHSLSWNDAAHLYTWGTYAVYIFFALSGASMYVAYAQRFERGYSVARFLALRFIRLAPLYLLGLVLATAYAIYKGGFRLKDAGEAVLNLALVFGLGNPGITSKVIGGWSIGVEVVFYLLFPVMLAMTASKRWLWFLAGAFVAQHLFINTVLAGRPLAEGWPAYTQFLAFVFYFAAGCAVGRAMRERKIRPGWLSAPLFVGGLALLALSSGQASEHSLTGPLGMLLSLTAAAVVASSAVLQFNGAGHWASDILGRASYGVYILHPWVWAVVNYAGRKAGADALTVAALTAVLSVPAALFVNSVIEHPVQRYLKARLSS